MTNRSLPSSTLMISTYNWPEALEACLKSAFRQKRLPQEIIVADDGSDSKTAELIHRMQAESPVPLIHIWHPDEGFRLGEIRNKAIVAASTEYIIQIDGDIVMDPYFVYDHLSMAAPDKFLCGSRVLMDPSLSQRILKEEIPTIHKRDLPIGYLFNSFRVPYIGRILADRYKQKNITALRGCNMSFWKKDLMKINGYNCAITGWGSEDAELAIRLTNAGIKKRFLKFLGVAFHLYHREQSKSNLEKNRTILREAIQQKTTWISQGIQ